MTPNNLLQLALAVLMVPTVVGAQKAPPSRAEPFDSVFRLVRSVPLKATPQEPVGEVRQIAVSGERVYVVDGSNANVKVFDLTSGSLLRTMGRSGYGPGEMRRVAGIVVDADGSITTIDNTRQVIVRLDSMGRLIAEQRLQGQWNGITQILVGTERRTILTGRVGVTTREGGIPVEDAPKILHEADSTGILRSFYPIAWPPTPWQRSFANYVSSAVGSTVATGDYGTNLVRFRDWATNREWMDTLNAPWMKPIAWPQDDRFGAGTKIEQMTAWLKQQTLVHNVLLGSSGWYVAVVQMYDASGEKQWGHILSQTRGGGRIVTPPGSRQIQHVRGDTGYVLREDESGDYVLEVRRVRVSR
jgi:hypothetical protein